MQSAAPEASLQRLRECGPAEAVITLGDQGSVGLGPHGLIRQHAFPVSALDTTGAGDVYHGAYIYGLLQDWPMGRCMEFASGASAMACRRVGGRRGSPGLSDLMAFLQKRNAAFF